MFNTLFQEPEDILSRYEGVDLEMAHLDNFDHQVEQLSTFCQTLRKPDVHVPTLISLVSPNGELTELLGVDPLTLSLEELQEAADEAEDNAKKAQVEKTRKYLKTASIALAGILAAVAAYKFGPTAMNAMRNKAAAKQEAESGITPVEKVGAPSDHITEALKSKASATDKVGDSREVKKFLDKAIATIKDLNSPAGRKYGMDDVLFSYKHLDDVKAFLSPAEKEHYRQQLEEAIKSLKGKIDHANQGPDFQKDTMDDMMNRARVKHTVSYARDVALKAARLLGH